MEDFQVVCTNYSKSAFKIMALELLNFEVDICGQAHKYNMFKLDNRSFIVMQLMIVI